MFFFVKVLVSALIIALASQAARYNRLLATLLISLPLTSILSFIWIYVDTKDTVLLSKMSMEIFWLVIVSLIFFLVFSLLLNKHVSFWIALLVSSVVLMIFYGAVTVIRTGFFP